MDTTTKTTTNILPTIINSQSFDFGLILFQMSIVNIALLELKIEVKEDIKAAIITANMSPLAPGGISSITSLGYAILEQPLGLPQIDIHSSGVLQPISSIKYLKLNSLSNFGLF